MSTVDSNKDVCVADFCDSRNEVACPDNSLRKHKPFSQLRQTPKPNSDRDFAIRPVSSLTSVEFSALEELAYQHGTSADSYLAVEKHRYCWLASDRTAAFSVIRTGRVLHISGGLLAPAECHLDLIRQLHCFSQDHGYTIACYSLNQSQRDLFEEAGWEVSKIGEDTPLALEDLTWSGKSYQWVRRQDNYCQRQGVKCREILHLSLPMQQWKDTCVELSAIHEEDLRGRVFSQELGLLVGRQDPLNLHRRRLFVAEIPGVDRIEAYVIANPMRGGASWALEMYRKRRDAPRGVMAALMKQTIDLLRAEGAEQASLCLIPWKDCQTYQGQRASRLVSVGLRFASVVGAELYNVRGMTQFKTRFRPNLTDICVAVTPRSTVGSILNFAYTLGMLSLNPWNLVRQSLRIGKNALRRNL